MSEQTHINVDEISAISDRVPPGRYTARLNAVEGKASKAGKPMVQATFEVLKGEHEGRDATAFYSLTVSQGKDGRKYASGIIEMKRAFSAVNAPLPNSYSFPLDASAAAKLFHSKIYGKNVEIAILEEIDTKGNLDSDGNPKKYTRVKVLGAGSSPSTVVATPAGDDFD